MVDDIVQPVTQEVTEKIAETKTWWETVKSSFKHSLTILWARVQWFGGAVAAGSIAAFSGYDFTQLAAMDARDIFKMLTAVAVAGVLTELARRRTL